MLTGARFVIVAVVVSLLTPACADESFEAKGCQRFATLLHDISAAGKPQQNLSKSDVVVRVWGMANHFFDFTPPHKGMSSSAYELSGAVREAKNAAWNGLRPSLGAVIDGNVAARSLAEACVEDGYDVPADTDVIMDFMGWGL